jgi:hypothetical protein
VTQFADGLRELADWYEAHPTIELPTTQRFDIFLDNKAEFAAIARAMGTLEKVVTGDDSYSFVILKKSFGPVSLDANASRDEVCVSRQVGTRTVTRQVATDYKTIEVEEPIIEWDCPSLLADDEVVPA